MICPDCGSDNIAGEEICQTCGSDLMSLDIPQPTSGLQKLIMTSPISILDPPEPLLMSPQDSVGDAIKQMKEKQYGSVLVVEKDKLIGIFTETDILFKIIGKDIDLKKTKLSDVMMPEPVTLNEEDVLAYALNRMSVGGFRHIPLIEEDGYPTGFTSVRGVLGYISDHTF